MQRDANDTVTHSNLPVLVPATEQLTEGLVTFMQEFGTPGFIRTFKNGELRDAKNHLTKFEAKHFFAVIELTNALQNPTDSIALHNALENFEKARQLCRAQGRRLGSGIEEVTMNKVGLALAHLTGLPPQEAIEHFEGMSPGPRARQDPRWLLSYEISKSLDDARLVLWWTGSIFKPAIWCPDIKTAFYARALLSVVGGRGLRVCPHCSEPFLQERPDQNYCSVAHREAHRVARWRAAQKSKTSKKAGKRDGSRKTR